LEWIVPLEETAEEDINEYTLYSIRDYVINVSPWDFALLYPL